ncbi:hydrogenase expression/formation protein HypE [Deltaproteobacteria bacterium TL4]
MSHSVITLDHGSGGVASRQLLYEVFGKWFSNGYLQHYADGAVLPFENQNIAFTTDSFVVTPLFFPGGSIASLAINGTVNDLCMVGGIPQFLSSAFLIEEGFSLGLLEQIVQEMAQAAQRAGVLVVTGDTKVLPKGTLDGLIINTTGIGRIPQAVQLGKKQVQIGDHILINGTIADHGITILSVREELDGVEALGSDCAPLNSLLTPLLEKYQTIHFLRDPTRGGVAAVLNELVEAMEFGVVLNEEAIPIKLPVKKQSELLGIDPLYVANEGKVILVCAPEDSAEILDLMQAHPLGKEAQKIGEVFGANKGKVFLKTVYDSYRRVDMPQYEQLPRIC